MTILDRVSIQSQYMHSSESVYKDDLYQRAVACAVIAFKDKRIAIEMGVG